MRSQIRTGKTIAVATPGGTGWPNQCAYRTASSWDSWRALYAMLRFSPKRRGLRMSSLMRKAWRSCWKSRWRTLLWGVCGTSHIRTSPCWTESCWSCLEFLKECDLGMCRCSRDELHGQVQGALQVVGDRLEVFCFPAERVREEPLLFEFVETDSQREPESLLDAERQGEAVRRQSTEPVLVENRIVLGCLAGVGDASEVVVDESVGSQVFPDDVCLAEPFEEPVVHSAFGGSVEGPHQDTTNVLDGIMRGPSRGGRARRCRRSWFAG